MLNRTAQLLALVLILPLVGCSKNPGSSVSGQASQKTQSASQPEGAQNEAAAASSMRQLNTAEVVYASAYPAHGFAASLAVLGPGSSPNCRADKADATHACLIESALGCSSSWCVKSGYQFAIVSSSKADPIAGYTITATPINAANGRTNYCSNEDAVIRCSNEDAVIRLEIGPPREKPITKEDCKRWAPI